MSERLITTEDAILEIDNISNFILTKSKIAYYSKLTDTSIDIVNKFLENNYLNLKENLRKIDLKKTLLNYDNGTLFQILKKCYLISNSLSIQLLGEYDTFTNTDYSVTIYSEDRYMQDSNSSEKNKWVMQNSNWGDFWTTANEEQIKKLNNQLAEALKKLNYSELDIQRYTTNEEDNNITIKLKNELKNRIKSNEKTIKSYTEKLSAINNSSSSRSKTQEQYNLEKNKDNYEKGISKLKKENDVCNEVLTLLHDKVSQSGCKIVASAQLFSELLDDNKFDPKKVIPYTDKEGNLNSISIVNNFPNIHVKELSYEEIFYYNFPSNSFILAKADVKGGVGQHWVVVKQIRSKINVKTGTQLMIYDVIYSSSNDKDRYFTSDYLNNPNLSTKSDTKKAKVTNLVIYTKD